jgi:hypothetical protein
MIALIAKNNGFLVREQCDEQLIWKTMTEQELRNNLSRRVVGVKVGKKVEKKSLWDFFKVPVINGTIRVYRDVFFCRELDPYWRHFDVAGRAFYIWNGHDVDMREEPEMDKIEPWLDFVKEVICNNDEKMYDYLIKAFAWTYQNPAKHLGWAPVLVSSQGCGKNCFTDTLCKLWGPDYTRPNLSSPELLLNDKSKSVIENRKLIVCNELASSESQHAKKSNFDMLKSRITEDYISVRAMFQDVGDDVRNVANCIFISNHADSVPLESSDRRYLMLKLNEIHIGDHDFWSYMWDRVIGCPSFHHELLLYFLRVDVGAFNPHWCPLTDFKREVIESFEAPPIAFIKQFQWEQVAGKRYKQIQASKLWSKYLDWCLQNGMQEKFYGSQTKFGLKLMDWVEKDKKGCIRYTPKERLAKFYEERDAEIREAHRPEDFPTPTMLAQFDKVVDDLQELREKEGLDPK